jgi:rubrerythrin
MSPASSMAVSMIDRFANPAAYYKEAKERGTFTIVPGKIPQEKEIEELKTSVPEKLKNIDNPYLPEKAKQKLIEDYEKGKGFAQQFQLAFPAIFEALPQIDLLLPAPGPASALGSRPILSNWFKSKTSGKSNLDREFDANAIQSLLNTSDISKNEQKKEILQTLIDDFEAERKAATGFFENLGFVKPTEKKVTGADFEKYVLKRIADLQPKISPSVSANKGMTLYGTPEVFENMAVRPGEDPRVFTSSAGTIEQNPSAIAVGYAGVHPFFYSKSMGDGFEHTVIAGEFPKSVSDIGKVSDIMPNLGYFGHFRKLNLNTPEYVSKIQAYDPTIPETMFAFEIQQDAFKPFKFELKTPTGTRTIYSTPTTLETQVYILLNKALSNKFYDKIKRFPSSYLKNEYETYATDVDFLRGGMEEVIARATVSEPSFIVDQTSLGKFMDSFRQKLYGKYYFKDGKVNPNFAEEVNKLDPYSFFNEREAELLRKEFPLTLNEKIISVSGKNKDNIATGLIVEAAIKKAIQQGDKYIAFPTIHTAQKLQSWTVQGTNLNKYNNAITKNAKPYIKEFFQSGVGNKTTGFNYVNLYDGKGINAFNKSSFNKMIELVEVDMASDRVVTAGPEVEKLSTTIKSGAVLGKGTRYIDGIPVKNTFKNFKYSSDERIVPTPKNQAEMSFATTLISEMEYLRLISTNKMPDDFDLSIDKVFKNFVIMGKTDDVNVVSKLPEKFSRQGEISILNSVEGGAYLKIPEELRDKFKNPEFILTLAARSAKAVDEGDPGHVSRAILRTIFNTNDSQVIYKELSKILEGKKAHLKAFNKNVKKEYEQMLDARNQKIIDSAGQESISLAHPMQPINDAERIKISQYEPYVEDIENPYMYHPDNLDKIFEGTTPSYKSMYDVMEELHKLQDHYKAAHNFLTKYNFFSPTFKEDMAIGYKQTNYGGLVDTYTDKIPNIFKQAGIETEIVRVPRMSIAGETEYADDAVEEFLRIKLTPENVKKLQEYKTNLFTNSILPRVSKEEENNKKTIFGPLTPSQRTFMNMGLLDVQLGS